MAGLGIKNYPKRVVFPKGKQKIFLEQAIAGLSLKELADLSRVSVRSLTDWKRERFSISLFAFQEICRKLKVSPPEGISIESPFWYTSLGSRKGGVAVYKKYGGVGGDAEYRKQRWYEWWNSEGKFKKRPIASPLPVYFPPPSPKLAEFIGILLGDGGITKRQVSITLHKNDDRDFSIYVRDLIKQLFSVAPSLYQRKGENVVSVVVSRSELVRFFREMGLSIGSKVKRQIDVPSWIRGSARFTKSCIRGLFDTDGCFYLDKHVHREREYENCCMSFTNRSLPLLSFFREGLSQLGFRPTQTTEFSMFLRRERDILRYFEIIGTSNEKHRIKFLKYFRGKYGEVPKRS